MIYTSLLSLCGLKSGFIITDLINYYYKKFQCNISNTSKYNIIICTTFIAF